MLKTSKIKHFSTKNNKKRRNFKLLLQFSSSFCLFYPSLTCHCLVLQLAVKPKPLQFGNDVCRYRPIPCNICQ